MSDADERHAAFVERLREASAAPERILDAFARVPRHLFLPDVPLDGVYSDDAVVTRDEGGVPTSSSTQPSLMARMLDQLDVRPGDRVLEVGTGTGYNAAVLAALGAAVTTVELQPEVAVAAVEHLAAAGIHTRAVAELDVEHDTPGAAGAGPGGAGDAGADVAPGSVRVVTGDGAAPPGGPYDRVIVTAGCWSLSTALVASLADGGVLVAPLRINGIELVLALRRDGRALRGSGGIPCGFMPLRGGDERPWRWPLGGGGFATADADLGDEGHGALDRLLATPGRKLDDPLELGEDERVLDALLWLGLRGDPLIGLAQPAGEGRPAWTVGLYVLPASLLVGELSSRFDRVAGATLYGGEGALRACRAAMASWRAAGAPGPAELELTIEPAGDRDVWSLPFPRPDGTATLTRGDHRWTLRYAGTQD
jgi:protein-L-isoaspartate(D-aspartate) O-methyltransferase